jgi:hypothetical protein
MNGWVDTSIVGGLHRYVCSTSIGCGKEMEQPQQETSVVDIEMPIIKNSER